MPNQPRNHAQLLFVMPVSKYIQVISPINGIREYFFTMLSRRVLQHSAKK